MVYLRVSWLVWLWWFVWSSGWWLGRCVNWWWRGDNISVVVGITTVVTEERMSHTDDQGLEVNLPLLVAVLLQVAVVQVLDTVMESTSGSDSSEVDVMARDGTGSCLTLRNVAVVIGDNFAHEFLKRLLLLVQAVALDFVVALELGAEWDQFFGDHWNELSSILPVTNVVVNLVEEGLTTHTEVLQVTPVCKARAVTGV